MMKYFSLQELTRSDTARRLGIDNRPDEEAAHNLQLLVENILDPLREAWGEPIIVTSGYRSARLNKAVGGARSSQHLLGQAADIRALSAERTDNRGLFYLAVQQCLPFDQIIDEYDYSWIHLSYSPRNRRQILHLK